MRKDDVLKDIEQSAVPLSATKLAKKYNVSRQVIVQDIALLRASGNDIIATARGYIMQNSSTDTKTIAVKHTAKETRDELYAIVDEGCKVIDVIVEHPLYGELKGQLNLQSRHDVDEFLQKSTTAAPLSLLTEGVHLHTIQGPEENCNRVIQKLTEMHILITEDK